MQNLLADVGDASRSPARSRVVILDAGNPTIVVSRNDGEMVAELEGGVDVSLPQSPRLSPPKNSYPASRANFDRGQIVWKNMPFTASCQHQTKQQFSQLTKSESNSLVAIQRRQRGQSVLKYIGNYCRRLGLLPSHSPSSPEPWTPRLKQTVRVRRYGLILTRICLCAGFPRVLTSASTLRHPFHRLHIWSPYLSALRPYPFDHHPLSPPWKTSVSSSKRLSIRGHRRSGLVS